MRGYILSLCLILCLVTGSGAQHAVESVAKGRAPTREKAIQAALLNAVTQIHGAALSTGIANVDMETGAIGTVVNPFTGSRRTSVDNVSVQSAGTLTLMETQGLIKSYEVLEEKRLDDQSYEITAKAWVFNYESPEDVKERRLAVTPVEVTAASCVFGDKEVSKIELSRQFTQLLSAALSQNEHFTLLDRDSNTALQNERAVLSEADVPLSEKSRLRSTLGSDYIVAVNVPQAEILVKETTNPIVGRPTRRFDAKVRVEYRLLVAPTRQVSLVDDLRIYLEDRQIKALSEDWRADEIDYDELRRNFMQLAAAHVARAVSDHLRPVKVAAVVDGSYVILNQGGSRFLEKDEYAVFRLGQAIVDPETQKELARHEELVGTIRIARVLSKVCYADIVAGDFDVAAVGSICRHARGLKDYPAEAEGGTRTKILKTSSGGVRLPFDN